MKQHCTLEVWIYYNILLNSKVIRSHLLLCRIVVHCPCVVTLFSEQAIAHTYSSTTNILMFYYQQYFDALLLCRCVLKIVVLMDTKCWLQRDV